MIVADAVDYSGIFRLAGIRCLLMALAAGVSIGGLTNRASAIEISQRRASQPDVSTPSPNTMDEQTRFEVGHDPFEERFSEYDPFDEESPLALPVRNPQLASDRTIPPSHAARTAQDSARPLRLVRLAQLAA